MLDSLGRFSSTSPFSHRYNISLIRRCPKQNTEQWLKQTFMQETTDWMLWLKSDLDNESKMPTVDLIQTGITASIQPWKAVLADRFIREHLNLGLSHLVPDQEFSSRFRLSNELAAWKIADQLMFMNDEWRMDQPSWLISIKTQLHESHILAIQMKFGLISIHFYHPIVDSSLNIKCTNSLADIPKLH